MKKFVTVIFLLSLIVSIWYYHEDIVTYILDNYVYEDEFIIPESNAYASYNNYKFVQSINNFAPISKQDLKNIMYTYLDRGWSNFSFYCPEEYFTCIQDMKALADDSEILSGINNFVHPFNSYEQLYVTINNFGKVTIQTKFLYSPEEQFSLMDQVDKVLNEVTNNQMTDKEKIKAVHDYIINNTKYDKARADLVKMDKDTSIQYPSHKAVGALQTGLALCSGYSDAMALFLNKLNIKNYKISSPEHVWNLVYLDNNWYHLDLTWDDPVVNTGEDLLLDDFFLITTEELKRTDLEQHNFNELIFIEAK